MRRASLGAIIPPKVYPDKRESYVVFGPRAVGRTSGHAGRRGIYGAETTPGCVSRFALQRFWSRPFHRRVGPPGGGAGRLSRPAEGALRTHRTRRLLYGNRGSVCSDRSRGRPRVREHGPRIARLPGSVGHDDRVGALRGSYLASEGVGALVCGWVYRRLAGMEGHICDRTVWGTAWGNDWVDAWGNVVRVPLAGTRLHTLVCKWGGSWVSENSIHRKLNFRKAPTLGNLVSGRTASRILVNKGF